MKLLHATRMTILALLLSLAFSSGEGLRLFPIPVSVGVAAVPGVETLSQASSHRYQYAARVFAQVHKQGGSTAVKGKHGAGVVAGPPGSPDLRNQARDVFPSSHFEWAKVDSARAFLDSMSGRGPPSS